MTTSQSSMNYEHITYDLANELISYDAESGKFYWKCRDIRFFKTLSHQKTWNTRYAHKEAGSSNGIYVYVQLAGKNILAHRLAWFLTTKSWPNGVIDHINCIKNDNRISNLRDVTQEINTQNQILRKKSKKSGLPLGVFEAPQCASVRYRACIGANGTQKVIGFFDSPEAAHEAYLVEKRKMHKGCTI